MCERQMAQVNGAEIKDEFNHVDYSGCDGVKKDKERLKEIEKGGVK